MLDVSTFLRITQRPFIITFKLKMAIQMSKHYNHLEAIRGLRVERDRERENRSKFEEGVYVCAKFGID